MRLRARGCRYVRTTMPACLVRLAMPVLVLLVMLAGVPPVVAVVTMSLALLVMPVVVVLVLVEAAAAVTRLPVVVQAARLVFQSLDPVRQHWRRSRCSQPVTPGRQQRESKQEQRRRYSTTVPAQRQQMEGQLQQQAIHGSTRRARRVVRRRTG